MPAIGPNFAFLLIVAGLLLIYGEFIWVGKVWFGVSGAICVLAGVAAFAREPRGWLGFGLIFGALVCFAMEAGFETFRIAGVLGSALCAAGFWKLGVFPPEACCGSAVFGIVTTWLLAAAKRARRNKRLL